MTASEIVLALWHATFSKYESWEANGVSPARFKKQVLADFRKLSKMTEKIIFK